MNPQDPLAGLHPLREPPPVGWWPPAPGWWLLLVMLLAVLAAVGYYLFRRYRAGAYRRRALAQLERLRETYRGDGDDRAYLAGINALLKRVALLAYPDRGIAARSGRQWLDFLNGSCPADRPFPDGFASAAYLRERPALDLEQLHGCAATWIKRHEVKR